MDRTSIGGLVAVAGLVLACAPVARSQRIEEKSPGERIGHGLAYDELRRVVILLGGVSPAGVSLGDTWSWNGERWHQLSTTGPSPRKWPTMTFHSAEERMILFGGRVGAGDDQRTAADTWEWTGSGWRQLDQSGPPPRDHAAMAYDRARERIILAGGWSGDGFLGDTWEWTSGGWRLLNTSGPTPRAAHTLTYDESRQELVLFGGRSPDFLGDTWVLRNDAWSIRTPGASPAPRAFHATGFDRHSASVVLFGGRDGPQLFEDTWRWNGSTWTRSEHQGPSARGVYALVFDGARGELVFHGGGSMPADRWVLHDETWVLAQGGWRRRWPPGR